MRFSLEWLLAALVVLPTRAQAQGRSMQLAWTAPSGCPSGEQVADEAERLRHGVRDGKPGIVVRARVEHDEGRPWRVKLTVDAATLHSERTFVAESCPEAAAATELIAAIAMDEASTFPPEAEDRGGGSSRVPPSAAASRAGVSVAATGTWTVGVLPYPALGAEASLAWVYGNPRWRGRALAGADWFAPQSARVNEDAIGSPESAHFTSLRVLARACLSRVLGALEIGPCAGVGLEQMWANGGTESPEFAPRSVSRRWGVLLGSVLATYEIAPGWAFYLQFEGATPLARPSFVVNGPAPAFEQRSVYQPPALGVGGASGVELHFF